MVEILPVLARMKTETIPYWLLEGTEECEGCSHRHVLQMIFRCVECDSGLCVHCIAYAWDTREIYCHSCYGKLELT